MQMTTHLLLVKILLKRSLALQTNTESIFIWIKNNFLKANPNKSHVVLSDSKERIIRILSDDIANTHSEKLLGITVDSELKFDIHVKSLCKKASLKLHALSRISNFMTTIQLKVIMKAFILSQFNYCPLVWMFHSRELNNRINRIHERALRLAYKDYSSSFQELLSKDNAVTIHNRNLQILAVEVYKFVNGISPKIMGGIFELNQHSYNLRSGISFKSHNIKTVHYGLQSISYLAPRIWNLVPDTIKNTTTVSLFKGKIKNWVPENGPCRLCKTLVPNLGFL